MNSLSCYERFLFFYEDMMNFCGIVFAFKFLVNLRFKQTSDFDT
jgi:hypothetical protein